MCFLNSQNFKYPVFEIYKYFFLSDLPLKVMRIILNSVFNGTSREKCLFFTIFFLPIFYKIDNKIRKKCSARQEEMHFLKHMAEIGFSTE